MTFGGDSSLARARQTNSQQEPWRLKYFGVGNENWGCGGNMTASEYATVYRRYQTYVRSYGDNKIYKVACGSNDFRYEWTETLMQEAGRHMDGLSLHYYTVTGTWAEKGSATGFAGLPVFAQLLTSTSLIVVDEPSTDEVARWLPYIEAKDAPIVAAAIYANADRLLTLNHKDFTPQVAAVSGLTIQLPGEFAREVRSIITTNLL